MMTMMLPLCELRRYAVVVMIRAILSMPSLELSCHAIFPFFYVPNSVSIRSSPINQKLFPICTPEICHREIITPARQMMKLKLDRRGLRRCRILRVVSIASQIGLSNTKRTFNSILFGRSGWRCPSIIFLLAIYMLASV